ncbi:MAG: GNAT family acetyltransferase [Alphaproteobacteria bacterium]
MRHATQQDRDAIITLWDQCDLMRPWNDPIKDFDRALAGDNAVILVTEQTGDIIGTIMVGEDGHRGWVYYLAVDPHARRGGVGRQLMQAAEDWITQRNIPKAQLMVRTDNEAATGFYKALGYEVQAVATLGKRLIDH